MAIVDIDIARMRSGEQHAIVDAFRRADANPVHLLPELGGGLVVTLSQFDGVTDADEVLGFVNGLVSAALNPDLICTAGRS